VARFHTRAEIALFQRLQEDPRQDSKDSFGGRQNVDQVETSRNRASS